MNCIWTSRIEPSNEEEELIWNDLLYQHYEELHDIQERVSVIDLGEKLPIIAIGLLDLWNGTKLGYKIIESGNVADCFEGNKDTEDCSFFVDEDSGDLIMWDYHHDGINKIAFYIPIREEYLDIIISKILDHSITRKDIKEYLFRLGFEVKNRLYNDKYKN